MRLIVFFSALLLITGCKKEQLDDCFSSTGDDISIERPLKSFSQLYVGDKFKVVLTQDTSRDERIIITGGANILEGISATVENNKLVVENCNTCNFVRSYNRLVTVEIFLHDLTKLELFGAAQISCSDTLHLTDLEIYHSALEDMELLVNASGTIYLESINSGGSKFRGRAFKLSGSVEEITDMDARDLVCEEVILDTHSPLDCYINATDLIYVGVFNKGNLYYVNEPSKQKTAHTESSTGRLLKLP